MANMFVRTAAHKSGLELRAELLRVLDGPVTLTPRETKDGTVWTLTTALNLAAELPADKAKAKARTPTTNCGRDLNPRPSGYESYRVVFLGGRRACISLQN
jgi:hypothetical protein